MVVAIFEHVIIQCGEYGWTSGEECVQQADNFTGVFLVEVDDVGVEGNHVSEDGTKT